MASEGKKRIEGESDEQKKAEAFADRMEAKLRKLGSTADFFCASQKLRWRQHSIRAYLGLSPDPETESALPTSSNHSKP
jgi:CHASE1-domain containing sensor protein